VILYKYAIDTDSAGYPAGFSPTFTRLGWFSKQKLRFLFQIFKHSICCHQSINILIFILKLSTNTVSAYRIPQVKSGQAGTSCILLFDRHSITVPKRKLLALFPSPPSVFALPVYPLPRVFRKFAWIKFPFYSYTPQILKERNGGRNSKEWVVIEIESGEVLKLPQLRWQVLDSSCNKTNGNGRVRINKDSSKCCDKGSVTYEFGSHFPLNLGSESGSYLTCKKFRI
jgi:hypothetical protein